MHCIAETNFNLCACQKRVSGDTYQRQRLPDRYIYAYVYTSPYGALHKIGVQEQKSCMLELECCSAVRMQPPAIELR